MTFETEIDLDIYDVIDEMSDTEKKKMYAALSKEFKKPNPKPVDELISELRKLTAFDLKKVLCNVLNVPCYYEEKKLRQELEIIINSR